MRTATGTTDNVHQKKKILLIGATGQLGSEILGGWKDIHDLYAPDRSALDLAEPAAASRVIDACKPDVVINTAAFHNVPLCETEQEAAFRINCVAVYELAKCCKKNRSMLITFSTDYVFDGEKGSAYYEDDRPAPLQIYGISRLAGEHAALSAWPDKTLVIRTCGLYGMSGAKSKGGNFVDKRIEDSRLHKTLEMSCEQTVSPTYARDLSDALLQMVNRTEIVPGIYHLTNEGACSWAEFTKAIFDILRIDTKVVPVDRRGLSGSMRRPLYTALGNRRARSMGITLPDWKNALSRYLERKYSASMDTRP